MAREVGDLLRLVGCYEQAGDTIRRAEPALSDRIDAIHDEADIPYLRENLPRMTEATRQGLQRVAKIVENLREFAHLDRSEIATIDINVALEHTLGMLSGPLAENKITVEKAVRAGSPRLKSCAAPIELQVFLNLLMNALQAIESTGRRSGRIEVATRWEDGEIVVEIADDGCGIPPEILPKIFDPFFTTKPLGRGTGLGLSIGHGIIAEHGGRIDVESTVGAGSRFRIHLPIDAATPPTPAGSPESAA